MKPVSEGKSRLAGAISGEKRVLISTALLLRVLKAATGCSLIEDVWVYGGDAVVRSACDRNGAVWREDPGVGLNGCMTVAFSDAAQDGMDAAMFLPADLPLVTPVELSRFIEAGSGIAVALAPDALDDGTNALMVELDSGFQTVLGESSFSRHVEQSHRLGVEPVVHRSEEFGLDIDTPDDIEHLALISPDIWDALRREIQDAALDGAASVTEGK